MEYLLKASAVILLFYLCYKILLQRETFFKSNRWFLLSGLFVALCVPFIVIPTYIEFTPTPFDGFITETNGITSDQITTKTPFDYTQLISWVYAIGFIFFLGKLCIEFTSLGMLLNKHSKYKKGAFTYIETKNNVAPFSFFKWIVYNPNQYNKTELEHIISHEKVHAKQWHSIDVIFAQLACVVFWFNPFIWLYKKELQQNLEFIADYNAQKNSECEQSYQLVLLKSSVPNHNLVLINNFYNSLIKKRIIMLHKSKSNKLNVWKYAIIIPSLALFLMSFNTKEIYVEKNIPKETPHVSLANSNNLNMLYATLESKTPLKENKVKPATKTIAKANTTESKALPLKSKTISGDHEMVIITKNFSDEDFEKVKKQLDKEGITIKFKGIKRNKSGEITAIKIDVDSKQSNANYNINGYDAIQPIKISFDREGGNISIGNSSNIHVAHGNSYVISDDKHKIHTTTKGNSVFVISSDEDSDHETEIIISDGDKKSKTKRSKKVYRIRTTDDHDAKDKNIIFSDDKESNIEILWDDDEENGNVEIISVNKGKNNNIFIAGDDDKNLLYILNGKEITKKEMNALNADSIEKVEVLKGDKATEKYGDKAKDGVIIITTK